MRAILRWSLDGDKKSALRNKLMPILTQNGFAYLPNTATLEAPHIDASDLANVLQAFWSVADAHRGPARVDHFWLYTDRTDVDNVLADDG